MEGLEKFAHNQVVRFLNKSKVLDGFHTGFCKHYNNQTGLLKLIIRMGKDKKLVKLLLQFNFSKAFDNVSLSKLLQKSKDIDFSKLSLQWFWSYISGRSMCVTKIFKDLNITNIKVNNNSDNVPFIDEVNSL